MIEIGWHVDLLFNSSSMSKSDSEVYNNVFVCMLRHISKLTAKSFVSYDKQAKVKQQEQKQSHTIKRDKQNKIIRQTSEDMHCKMSMRSPVS